MVNLDCHEDELYAIFFHAVISAAKIITNKKRHSCPHLFSYIEL